MSGFRTSTWLSEVVFSFLIPDSSRLSRGKETRSAEKKKHLNAIFTELYETESTVYLRYVENRPLKLGYSSVKDF